MMMVLNERCCVHETVETLLAHTLILSLSPPVSRVVKFCPTRYLFCLFVLFFLLSPSPSLSLRPPDYFDSLLCRHFFIAVAARKPVADSDLTHAHEQQWQCLVCASASEARLQRALAESSMGVS